MASRRPEPTPPPDPVLDREPELGELVVDPVAVDLTRDYVGLPGRRPDSRPAIPEPSPKED